MGWQRGIRRPRLPGHHPGPQSHALCRELAPAAGFLDSSPRCPAGTVTGGKPKVIWQAQHRQLQGGCKSRSGSFGYKAIHLWSVSAVAGCGQEWHRWTTHLQPLSIHSTAHGGLDSIPPLQQLPNELTGDVASGPRHAGCFWCRHIASDQWQLQLLLCVCRRLCLGWCAVQRMLANATT
jgi:hypothetical protein